MSEFRWEILWIILVSLGSYALLVMNSGRGRTVLKATVGITVAVGLWLLLTGRESWWAESEVVAGFAAVLLPLLATVSVCCALVTITTRNERMAATCFVAMVLSNAILFLVVGAHLAAIAAVVFSTVAGFALFGLWDATRDSSVAFSVEGMLHEPFLSCLMGGGLAVGLVVTGVGATHLEGSSENDGRQTAALPGFRTIQLVAQTDADGSESGSVQTAKRHSEFVTNITGVAVVVVLIAVTLIVVTVLHRADSESQSVEVESLQPDLQSFDASN